MLATTHIWDKIGHIISNIICVLYLFRNNIDMIFHYEKPTLYLCAPTYTKTLYWAVLIQVVPYISYREQPCTWHSPNWVTIYLPFLIMAFSPNKDLAFASPWPNRSWLSSSSSLLNAMACRTHVELSARQGEDSPGIFT